MLTERERWLVIEGFIAGFNVAEGGPEIRTQRISDLAKAWLNDCIADAITVEMALATEGQKYDHS